jgi:hypothetical protein
VIALVGGGATAQHRNFSVWFGARLFMTHMQYSKGAPENIHEQIGIGTGEDLVFFCYLLLRWALNAKTLEIWRARNTHDSIDMFKTQTGYREQLKRFLSAGILDKQNAGMRLLLWDFDEDALTCCRKNLLMLAAVHDNNDVDCRIINRDVFKLSSYSEGFTTVSTAAAGPAFLLQTLLYCVGGETVYFIIDEPDNGKNLFELIEDLAVTMGFYGAALANLMKAAKTSMVETAKEGDRLHEKHINDAFHAPFMVSCLESEYGKTKEDLNHRHLISIMIPKFRKWLYDYLPPPKRFQVNSSHTDEQLWKTHAMVGTVCILLVSLSQCSHGVYYLFKCLGPIGSTRSISI